MYTITDLEDAIIAKLEALKATLGVRTIKSYQGELDDEQAIAAATRLFPAILVVYTGSDYEGHGSRKIELPRFTLFCCDKSLRTEGEARRGGAGNPGTYAMLNGARDLLCESRLDLDIVPLTLLAERPVWFQRGVSVYGAEYETGQALLYEGD